MHNKQEEKFKKKHEQQEKHRQHLDNGNILRNAQKTRKNMKNIGNNWTMGISSKMHKMQQRSKRNPIPTN